MCLVEVVKEEGLIGKPHLMRDTEEREVAHFSKRAAREKGGTP